MFKYIYGIKKDEIIRVIRVILIEINKLINSYKWKIKNSDISNLKSLRFYSSKSTKSSYLDFLNIEDFDKK